MIRRNGIITMNVSEWHSTLFRNGLIALAGHVWFFVLGMFAMESLYR